MTSVAPPSPLPVWRHCPNPDCEVSWCTTEPACWVCGARGQAGQLTNQRSEGQPAFETYTGDAPTGGTGGLS